MVDVEHQRMSYGMSFGTKLNTTDESIKKASQVVLKVFCYAYSSSGPNTFRKHKRQKHVHSYLSTSFLNYCTLTFKGPRCAVGCTSDT